MLSVNDLSCGYGGNLVLHNVSFDAHENQKLFIVGPNGCGKTTLLRAIANLLPHTGRVTLDGRSLGEMPKRQLAQSVAMMGQITAVYFAYTVLETVMQGRYPHQKSGWLESGWPVGDTRHDHEVAISCLERLGLMDLSDRRIDTLSGGQLQRVFLARALAQEPQVLLLDEPTNHLDIQYQLRFMDDLTQWVRSPGRMVIGVMHDINLALAYGDRLLTLKDGRVFAGGAVERLDLSLINRAFDADVTGFMRTSLKKWE